jgi:hypothetical protein
MKSNNNKLPTSCLERRNIAFYVSSCSCAIPCAFLQPLHITPIQLASHQHKRNFSHQNSEPPTIPSHTNQVLRLARDSFEMRCLLIESMALRPPNLQADSLPFTLSVPYIWKQTIPLEPSYPVIKNPILQSSLLPKSYPSLQHLSIHLTTTHTYCTSHHTDRFPRIQMIINTHGWPKSRPPLNYA